VSQQNGAGDRDTQVDNNDERHEQEIPECFVIMPISDPETYIPGHFRRVFEDLFRPACEQAGFHAVRADQVRQTNLIHLDVLQKIIDSPMALCDLSSRNPNVLFELGLRQAFDKPVVLVQEAGTLPIFDIAPLRITNYRQEMLYRDVIEDQVAITDAVVATKASAGDAKNVNSIVRLLGLTHAASLSGIQDGEQEQSFLSVIMAEFSTLRSEIRRARGGSPFRDYTSEITQEVERKLLAFLNRLQEFGLIEAVAAAFKIPRKIARSDFQRSNSLNEFITYVARRVGTEEKVLLELLFESERLALLQGYSSEQEAAIKFPPIRPSEHEITDDPTRS
jgi:hypothetical protein